ncbi:hypothetical protein SAMN02910289_00178 [Lachnospiraceae bacterium RM5]|nr:hypothetical protein SAMN02910289_00178 [Lachnospiraceae bacterium RM5]
MACETILVGKKFGRDFMNHENEKRKYILITCIIISTISVLACVAVVLFVFVLDIDFNGSKAKNSHNEDMEYAADSYYDSAKLADELAQQIQTAITDYETDYDMLCNDYGTIEIEWEEDDINIMGDFYNEAYIDEFEDILEDTTDLPKTARRIDGNVRAIIELNDGIYTIYTYIGDESAVR